jgi:gluconolactonase
MNKMGSADTSNDQENLRDGQQARIVASGLSYPESPYWSSQDGCLYFVEWMADRVRRWNDRATSLAFETPPGSGPCGLCQDRDSNFWVCLYTAGKLVKYTPAGTMLKGFDRFEGVRFKGPNDLVMDSRGGLYFTDSGDFEEDWVTGRPAGSVYYLSPARQLSQVATGLCYPNGLMITVNGKHLLINEHRKNRILTYIILPGGGLSDPQVLYRLDSDCLLDSGLAYEVGPDGMCLDGQGNIWVAHFGGGKIVAVSLRGRLLGMVRLPRGRKPTNLTYRADTDALYVTEAEFGLLYQIDLNSP